MPGEEDSFLPLGSRRTCTKETERKESYGVRMNHWRLSQGGEDKEFGTGTCDKLQGRYDHSNF